MALWIVYNDTFRLDLFDIQYVNVRLQSIKYPKYRTVAWRWRPAQRKQNGYLTTNVRYVFVVYWYQKGFLHILPERSKRLWFTRPPHVGFCFEFPMYTINIELSLYSRTKSEQMEKFSCRPLTQTFLDFFFTLEM